MSLEVTQLIGFGVGGGIGPKTISYPTSFATTDTDASSYSFTSTPIGTAGSDRYIVTAIMTRDATGTAPTVTNCTVGGQATTNSQNVQSLDGNRRITMRITTDPVTSGTTATVAVTTSATCTGCAIATWAVYQVDSTTSVATDSDQTSSGATLNASVTVPANSAIIGVLMCELDLITASWTGLTEQFEQVGGTDLISGAHLVQSTAATVSITANGSGGNQDILLVCAWY